MDRDQRPSKGLWAAIMLADISGSTPFYEAVGNAEAQRLISRELTRLQAAIRDEDGVVVRQKGDDVLGYFEGPSQALRALRAMLSGGTDPVLSVHAGLHYGQIVQAEGDIFGQAVNLTARLAALANDGEALLSRSFFDLLPASEAAAPRPLGHIRLKGVGDPIDVFSLAGDETSSQTRMVLPARGTAGRGDAASTIPNVAVILTHDHKSRTCREAESVLIGRSTDCGIVLSHPWISRKHAKVTVLDGKFILEDRSTSGTYVSMDGGHEFFLRRESIVLTGNGTISPAVRLAQPEADPIGFETIQR